MLLTFCKLDLRLMTCIYEQTCCACAAYLYMYVRIHTDLELFMLIFLFRTKEETHANKDRENDNMRHEKEEHLRHLGERLPEYHEQRRYFEVLQCWLLTILHHRVIYRLWFRSCKLLNVSCCDFIVMVPE